MNVLLETAVFSSKYLSRYWYRFALGIFLGFLFGMSNALTMGGIYLIQNRLEDPVKYAQTVEEKKLLDAKKLEKSSSKTSLEKSLKERSNVIKEKLFLWIDPWLPLKGRGLDWKQCLGCILLLPTIAAIRGFLGYGNSYLLAWSGQRITNDVKLDAFKKLSSLSIDYFFKTTTGELVARIENDAVGLNNFLKMGLADLVKEPFTILSTFCALLFIDWRFTVISLFFLPICIVPIRIIGKRLKTLANRDFDINAGQNNITMESFLNIRITKAYSLEAAHASLYQRAGQLASHFNMKSIQGREMLNPIIQTLSSLGVGLFFLYAIWIGADYSKITLFIVTLIFFNASFKKLSMVGVFITQMSISMERLMALFKLEPTVKEDPQALPFAHFHRAIEFKNVGFSYGDGDVLQSINFVVPAGKRLGLAGKSGSGKSSLLNLLFRFYDVTEGVVELDGVPINKYRLHDLRAQLALVSQDILLFNATVAENISYGKIGATRQEIQEAARRAHADKFIEALPNKYDTPLGERGNRLSGGQRQRIAIARAFVRNAPILVLDEATASLDSKSEAEVQNAIDELAENRTVICVAHRLSTLRDMNEILVLNDGLIIERGNFNQLLRAGGMFAAMAAQQSIYPQALDL